MQKGIQHRASAQQMLDAAVIIINFDALWNVKTMYLLIFCYNSNIKIISQTSNSFYTHICILIFQSCFRVLIDDSIKNGEHLKSYAFVLQLANFTDCSSNFIYRLRLQNWSLGLYYYFWKWLGRNWNMDFRIC